MWYVLALGQGVVKRLGKNCDIIYGLAQNTVSNFSRQILGKNRNDFQKYKSGQSYI